MCLYKTGPDRIELCFDIRVKMRFCRRTAKVTVRRFGLGIVFLRVIVQVFHDYNTPSPFRPNLWRSNCLPLRMR